MVLSTIKSISCGVLYLSTYVKDMAHKGKKTGSLGKVGLPNSKRYKYEIVFVTF